ncbi:MAG: family 20 glycosylhydrolase [Candidatus Lokiarchaeota archaeon]|nr:family 20 glycosylhydrolase [Candidatus Lokiarchaeota archaeon]
MAHTFTITNLDPGKGTWGGAPAQLVPVPRVVEIQGGTFAVGDAIDVESSLPPDYRYLHGLLSEELAKRLARGIRAGVHEPAPAPDAVAIPASLGGKIPAEQHYRFLREGYAIEISGGRAAIAAETPRGVFYAITTLVQLAGSDGLLPECKVLDWPSMEVRGVSDENARGQAGSIEGLKRYCRYIAMLKMNTFQMNLEDMFRSTRHPKSSDDERGCYSTEEMRELSDYAAQYFVEVTPIQSTCGHLDNLFFLPEYKHLAEFENVAMCFDISNPKVYDYIKDVVEEEVDSWYLSPSFHMACDESWDVGKGRSQAFVVQKGIGKAYLDHYTRCYEIVKNALEARHGEGKYRIYIYHDIMIHHPAVLKGLPRKNMVVDVWRYSPTEKYKEVDTILRNGFDFVVSGSVMDFQRIAPSYAVAEKNVINITKYAFLQARAAGTPHSFKGHVVTSWGDFRSENPRDLRMPGYALCASVSWNVEPWLAFTNKQHATYQPLLDFRQGFYRAAFGIGRDLAAKAAQLDGILMSIEGSKDFKPWLGYSLVFPKLWAHPLQPLKAERAKGYPGAVERFLKGVEACVELARACRDHAWYFDAVALALRLHVLYCKKVQLGNMLKGTNPTKAKGKAKERLLWRVDEVVKYFSAIKGEYRSVWEGNSKPVGHGFLLGQYDALIGAYGAIRSAIERGTSYPVPCIPAEYIHVPAQAHFDVPIRFTRSFKVGKEPVAAHLQAFAINHASLEVNGQPVGWVQYRPTLSYMLLDKCVKAWDVTGLVRRGENRIDVDVTNNTRSWCVLNLYLEVAHADGTTQRVISDRSWTCDTGAGLERGTVPVRSLGPPPSVIGCLTVPELAGGRRSHFTRMLGVTVEAVPHVPRWLLPLIVAIARAAKLVA